MFFRKIGDKCPKLKYDFPELEDSGNCIIRNICCIVFDLKRNVLQMKLNHMAPETLIAVPSWSAIFNKYHANEYSQINKYKNKVLAHL